MSVNCASAPGCVLFPLKQALRPDVYPWRRTRQPHRMRSAHVQIPLQPSKTCIHLKHAFNCACQISDDCFNLKSSFVFVQNPYRCSEQQQQPHNSMKTTIPHASSSSTGVRLLALRGPSCTSTGSPPACIAGCRAKFSFINSEPDGPNVEAFRFERPMPNL